MEIQKARGKYVSEDIKKRLETKKDHELHTSVVCDTVGDVFGK